MVVVAPVVAPVVAAPELWRGEVGAASTEEEVAVEGVVDS